MHTHYFQLCPCLHESRVRTSTRKRGLKKWLLPHQMREIFGAEIAADIMERKLNAPELKAADVMPHPDLPEKKECMHLSFEVWLGFFEFKKTRQTLLTYHAV